MAFSPMMDVFGLSNFSDSYQQRVYHSVSFLFVSDSWTILKEVRSNLGFLKNSGAF